MGLIETGLAWLEAQRKRHLTILVTYNRGASETPCQASLAKSVFELADEYGRFERIETQDFIFAIEDIASLMPPERGDQITREGVGGKNLTYEVMSPAGGPHYRYPEPDRLSVRLHTKLVSED